MAFSRSAKKSLPLKYKLWFCGCKAALLKRSTPSKTAMLKRNNLHKAILYLPALDYRNIGHRLHYLVSRCGYGYSHLHPRRYELNTRKSIYDALDCHF
jgi:hypothetical protein